jgi:hypothetical protein
MSEDIQRIPLSKKGQRQVTPFTGNELLFDYLSNRLDEERRKSVEAHLANSKEAQGDLLKIQTGLSYAERLRSITVSSALQERLATPSTYLSVLFRKTRFDQWPVGIKWGLEALIVVFVIVTALSLAPWEKVLKLKLSGSNEVVLTEINKVPVIETAETEVPNAVETPQFVDEGLKPKDSAKVSGTATTAVVKPTATAAVATVAAPTNPSVPTPTPQATAQAVTATTKATVQTVAAKESEESEDESDTPAAKPTVGFLYRGTLEVTNLEAVGPKIAEKITELGGRKAGEVELGWQKNKGSAYFHFTIPEAKYDELKEFLAGYGKPRINQEKHPRVMPDGIIRLIISVDEAKK